VTLLLITMSPNILITGATGYIGGTLLRALVSARVVPPSSIWAIVRSDTQAESVEHLQVNAVQVALTDEGGIQRAILDNGSTNSFYLCNEQTNH
jgi:uncharacterized protein YbjT (DUF2867 family)